MTPSARVLPHRALLFNCIALTTLSGPVHLSRTHLRIYVLGRSAAAVCCKCNTMCENRSSRRMNSQHSTQSECAPYSDRLMWPSHSVSTWWDEMLPSDPFFPENIQIKWQMPEKWSSVFPLAYCKYYTCSRNVAVWQWNRVIARCAHRLWPSGSYFNGRPIL